MHFLIGIFSAAKSDQQFYVEQRIRGFQTSAETELRGEFVRMVLVDPRLKAKYIEQWEHKSRLATASLIHPIFVTGTQLEANTS